MHPLTTYKTHLKKQRNLAALHTGKSHLHSQEDACSCASSKLSYCHTGSQRFHLGCTLRSGFNTQRRSASTELYFRPTCKRDFVGYFCFYAWNKPNQWRTIANLKLLQTIKPIAFSVEWAARIPPQENGGEQLLQNYTYRYLLGASNNKRTRSWEENNCNYFSPSIAWTPNLHEHNKSSKEKHCIQTQSIWIAALLSDQYTLTKSNGHKKTRSRRGGQWGGCLKL